MDRFRKPKESILTEFQKEFQQVLNNTGGVSGTMDAGNYSSTVQDSVDHAIKMLQTESTRLEKVPIDYVKGNLAEQWHAQTFNINAAARSRNDIWAKVPGNNVTGSDILYGSSNSVCNAELKYYKTAEETAKALSRPEYDSSNKIAPSGQIEEVIKIAERLGKKNIGNRPDQATNYQNTAKNTEQQLSHHNIDSEPLSEPVAKHLAKELRQNGEIEPEKYNLNTKNFVKWTDIGRESLEAGMHAAVLSAALTSAPYIWQIITEFIEDGEVDIKALEEGGLSILNNASHAGLRGAIAAGITASIKTGLLGVKLKGISPIYIGMATTIAINAINHSIKHQQGEITSKELMHLCMRDAYILSAGFCGAIAGQVFLPIPMLGALVGNIIGSVIGTFLYDGGNRILLNHCVDSGWSCFRIVKQDYTIPKEILKSGGYDFTTQGTSPNNFIKNTFITDTFTVDTFNFKPVCRGVIACNTIGYINI